VADIVDALAGSYAIEELTNQLEAKAADYIQKIDDLGGMLKAIEQGFPQREIQEAAYHYQKSVETNDAIVVGVNKFQIEEDETIPTLRIDEKIEKNQVERVRAVREKRDKLKAEISLANLKSSAQTDENLLPKILAAVENYVTVGEISHCLRSVWGEYQEGITF
jgi:methylmalonyl-CoA mutase N-terminal domain/subunit